MARIKAILAGVGIISLLLFAYLSYSYARKNSVLEGEISDLSIRLDAARQAEKAQQAAHASRDSQVDSLTQRLQESHDRLKNLEAQNEKLHAYLDVVVPDPVLSRVYDDYSAASGLPPSSRPADKDSGSSSSPSAQNRDYIELISKLYQAVGSCNADKAAVKLYYDRLEASHR